MMCLNERPSHKRLLEVCYNIGQYSHVDNVLVKITPDPSQPLFQFINAVDVCMVNTLLNGRSYLIVNRIELWSVSTLKIQQNKVWLLSTQQSDSFTCVMCRTHCAAETRLSGINLISFCKIKKIK